MTGVSTEDMWTMCRELSTPAFTSEFDMSDESSFGAVVAVEEQASGVDNSRFAIGFADEQMYYSMTGSGSTAIGLVLNTIYMNIEATMRVASPKKVLVVGGLLAGPLMIAKNVASQIHVSNSIHLDYFERHFSGDKPTYTVVSLQDISNEAAPGPYDFIIVHVPAFAHDTNFFVKLFNQLSVGGTMYAWSAHDQGNLFKSKQNHPYVDLYSTLKQLDGARVYQVPVSLGAALVVKEQ